MGKNEALNEAQAWKSEDKENEKWKKDELILTLSEN